MRRDTSLLTGDGADRASPVNAVLDPETEIVEVTVEGVWGRQLWSHGHRLLTEVLAAHPAGLILDLSRLEDPRVGSAPLWLTAASQGSHLQPAVPVVAALPGTAALAGKLSRPNARCRMSVYDTVAQARAELLGRGRATGRMRLRLPPHLSAAMCARHLVTTACEEWGLLPLIDRARLVLSELVVNAVEHAGTLITVVVSHRGDGACLHLAVHDADPQTPQMYVPQHPGPGAVLSRRGQGLRIVDAAAQAWGSLPTANGKMVWAVLREQRG